MPAHRLNCRARFTAKRRLMADLGDWFLHSLRNHLEVLQQDCYHTQKVLVESLQYLALRKFHGSGARAESEPPPA